MKPRATTQPQLERCATAPNECANQEGQPRQERLAGVAQCVEEDCTKPD